MAFDDTQLGQQKARTLAAGGMVAGITGQDESDEERENREDREDAFEDQIFLDSIEDDFDDIASGLDEDAQNEKMIAENYAAEVMKAQMAMEGQKANLPGPVLDLRKLQNAGIDITALKQELGIKGNAVILEGKNGFYAFNAKGEKEYITDPKTVEAIQQSGLAVNDASPAAASALAYNQSMRTLEDKMQHMKEHWDEYRSKARDADKAHDYSQRIHDRKHGGARLTEAEREEMRQARDELRGRHRGGDTEKTTNSDRGAPALTRNAEYADTLTKVQAQMEGGGITQRNLADALQGASPAVIQKIADMIAREGVEIKPDPQRTPVLNQDEYVAATMLTARPLGDERSPNSMSSLGAFKNVAVADPATAAPTPAPALDNEVKLAVTGAVPKLQFQTPLT